MIRNAREFEGRHETHALGHTARPLLLRQYIQRLTRNQLFGGVVAVLGDSL